MKNCTYRLSMLALLGASTALAQPPGPPDRPGPPGFGGGPRDGFRMPPHPVMEALDLNHDQVISEEEIRAASKSLLKLDKNGDGKLTHEETEPMFPGRPGGGDRGAGPRDGDRPEEADGRRPRGPDGSGGPPRDRDGGPNPNRPGGRGPAPESAGSGRPPEERGGFGGPGGGAGFQGPPPERFVAMAMEFDADKDGKLNRDELMKFAEELPMRRGGGPMGGPGGPGPRGPGRPDGERPEGGRPDGGRPDGGRPDTGRRDGGRPDSGQPERPRRPE